MFWKQKAEKKLAVRNKCFLLFSAAALLSSVLIFSTNVYLEPTVA